MKKLFAVVLTFALTAGVLSSCGNPSGNQPRESPGAEPTETVQLPEKTSAPEPAGPNDLAEYLWGIPANAGLEEAVKLELRNGSLIQAMEPIFEEESYAAYAKALLSLRSKATQERLEQLTAAKAGLVQRLSVAEGIMFLWKDFDSMPIADGESYTEEQLDAASLLGYGYTTILVNYLINDPAQAKGNVVMISGGAMKGRANGAEGYPAAKVFNEMGYNVFLLQRRVEPYSDIDIFMDCQRAVRVVRKAVADNGWGGADMIAACGYSGGAATVMGAVRECYGSLTPAEYDSDYVPDEIDAISSDMDAALIIYGASHPGDANTNLPAFFICQGTADDVVAADGPQILAAAAAAAGVPAQVLMIEGAPHGYGVGTEDSSLPEECRTWPQNADAFMQANRGHSGN